ncbi:Peptidase M23 [Candidatus Methylobacter favarea]|uniref:Peptidase M23 n=1 Tax=Candidatus Methylobacter favarea TaxID=2707345 RepID=A0A8S0X132_9GAMM|nr:M23 family metallopeptidase [Candidatus Methylobacter favarea]CAA9890998.1 Peptidase M23 [Candidatus Methylobacter favarea]
MKTLFALLMLAGLLLAAVLIVIPHPPAVFSLLTAAAPSALPIPVEGGSHNAIVDSWGSLRGRGRRHKGIDIFAKRGTRVLAPVQGLVLGIGQNRLGGNFVSLLGPGLQIHYFAHLDRFGPIKKFGLVQRGDVLGYVGNTGNAKATPPHLHYGLYVYPEGAINPYPLLMAAPAD